MSRLRALAGLLALPVPAAAAAAPVTRTASAQAAILKKAFMETQKDPDYLREAAQMQLDISPRSGDEIANVIQRIVQTPSALVARYKEILGSK